MKPGTIFANDYLIEKPLGSGGFADIYLATELDLERRVALKVMRSSADKANEPYRVLKERFFREARYLSKLKEPQTIRLYDYGEADEQRLYMALEFVEGRDLGKLLTDDGKQPPTDAMFILRQVLLGLREVHSLGVLHRDIKPGNVMIFERFGERKVKLLDFGIAKSLSPAHEDLTQEGFVIGTPRYLAPEQITGRALTEATDIYSVGLLGYELLTGAPPFGDANLTAIVEEEVDIIRQIERCEDLAPPLQSLLSQFLARRPEDRFESAQDAIDELDRIKLLVDQFDETRFSSDQSDIETRPKIRQRTPGAELATTAEVARPDDTTTAVAHVAESTTPDRPSATIGDELSVESSKDEDSSPPSDASAAAASEDLDETAVVARSDAFSDSEPEDRPVDKESPSPHPQSPASRELEPRAESPPDAQRDQDPPNAVRGIIQTHGARIAVGVALGLLILASLGIYGSVFERVDGVSESPEVSEAPIDEGLDPTRAGEESHDETLMAAKPPQVARAIEQAMAYRRASSATADEQASTAARKMANASADSIVKQALQSSLTAVDRAPSSTDSSRDERSAPSPRRAVSTTASDNNDRPQQADPSRPRFEAVDRRRESNDNGDDEPEESTSPFAPIE